MKKKRGNPRIKDFGVATRFKPGESGNPGGKPKTRIVAEMLSAIANEVDPESLKSYFQVACERLMKEVFRGNVAAFHEFADRVDGRSTQNVELRGGLQVERGESDWQREYQIATPERRDQMAVELDDKIFALAEAIKAKRADTPENRYRNRVMEYHSRLAAGESHEQIVSSYRTPAVN